MELYIIAGVLFLVAIYAIQTYNALVQKRTMSEEGWSGIDVQLKRRSDLIPNLVETVKGYAGHEQETLTKVTEMRAMATSAHTPSERGKAEGMLSGALANILALSEAYPDLKANSNFQGLQDSLSTIEDDLQSARRYYNATVRDLNLIIDSFPSNVVAGSFKFQKKEFFELESMTERAVPKISF